MAGKKGRSGGKRKGAGRKPAGHSEPAPDAAKVAADPPPALRATTASVEKHTAWVHRQAAAGVIGPTLAKALDQMGRTMLHVIEERRAATDLDEHRALAAEIKRERELIDRKIASLQRAGIDTSFLNVEEEPPTTNT